MLNRRALRIALAQQERTLKELAEQAGLDLLRVYRITSKNVHPHHDELKALADALGLSPADLEVEPR